MPYAELPTRFEPAKMTSGWEGVRDSKDFKPTVCSQMDFHEVCLHVCLLKCGKKLIRNRFRNQSLNLEFMLKFDLEILLRKQQKD